MHVQRNRPHPIGKFQPDGSPHYDLPFYRTIETRGTGTPKDEITKRKAGYDNTARADKAYVRANGVP